MKSQILSMTSTTKFYHVTQILSYMCSFDQSLVTLSFLWKKLSQPQFYKDLARKTAFRVVLLVQFNNLRLALGRKFWGLITTFVEVTGEKLVWGGLFAPPSSWIGLKHDKPKANNGLCCVVNFEQFWHIDIMLPLNILFFI